ncbi:MAG: hypothetical protein AVDCRST_MAG31-492, partial [uncultured Sphingomonas sp.]
CSLETLGSSGSNSPEAPTSKARLTIPFTSVSTLTLGHAKRLGD